MGMPRYLADLILNIQRSKSADARVRRAGRFVDYWRSNDLCAQEIEGAWSTLSKAARSDDDLFGLFAALPDEPAAEPFPAINGKRHIDAGEEHRRNVAASKHALALRAYLTPQGLRKLSVDARSNGVESQHALRQLRNCRKQLDQGLLLLANVLNSSNPKAKVLSRQYASPSLAMKNYRRLVADLNRFLSQPEHASLCKLANINCPAFPVKPNSVGKIWRRGDKASLAI